MTKVLIALLFTILPAVPLLAQSVDSVWVKRYNGPGNRNDIATDLVLDINGNVYVTGYSDQNIDGQSDFDFVTIRYYPNGDTAWVRRYSGSGDDDYAEALVVDKDGNVYVSGSIGSNLDPEAYSDFITIKYLPDGDTAWVRIVYGEEIRKNLSSYAIEVDDSGNVYATGTFTTIKYDSSGNCLWIGPFDFAGKDLRVDDAGNLYVTGFRKGGGTLDDYVIIKYYPNGDTAWVRTYNGTGNGDDQAYAIGLDYSGDVYVTGMSWGGGTSYDYATIKYYPDGEIGWVRRYNGSADDWDQATSMVLDRSGDVYVTGFSRGIETSHDYVTIKYRSDGDAVWTGRYNGPANSSDRAWAIAIDSIDNIYITGYSPGILTSGDYATVKYDLNGNRLWVVRYNGPGNFSDHASALSVDNSGNAYVTGWSDGKGTSHDYATLKYVQFQRGDANSDGYLSVLDVLYLINYLFKQGPGLEPLQSGDANCDGKVSLSDVVYLISYLLKTGPPPCI